jgi:hypothetical protein
MNVEVLIALLIVAGICFAFGYEIGVKLTEKRWSDAVAKGEWERKWGSR